MAQEVILEFFFLLLVSENYHRVCINAGEVGVMVHSAEEVEELDEVAAFFESDESSFVEKFRVFETWLENFRGHLAVQELF